VTAVPPAPADPELRDSPGAGPPPEPRAPDALVEIKRALRREFRARRRAIAPAERTAAAGAAAARLRESGLVKPRARIAVYLPADGEFDPMPIADLARARGALVYVPVIASARFRRLAFAPLDAPDAAWRRNRHGLDEPGADPRLWRSPRDLDLVLVPLVAFDAAGARLGMGGGYYDRAYAYLRHRTAWRRPRLLGLAFDSQEAAALPADARDVPLWGVLTGTRLLRASPA
jgi:5-formyltetrahydrofolate cyclo-ligase